MRYKLIVFDWNGTLSKAEPGSSMYELYPGVLELIKKLHMQGVLLVISTLHSKGGLQRELQFHGLESYFFDTLTADDFPPKPNPALLKALMTSLAISPSDVLMVGDTVTDLEYASAAGIEAIGVHFESSINNSSLKNNIIIKDIRDIVFFI